MKKDLLGQFKKDKNTAFDLETFKESVVGLFDDVLKRAGITDEVVLGKIARMRSRVEIAFKEL